MLELRSEDTWSFSRPSQDGGFCGTRGKRLLQLNLRFSSFLEVAVSSKFSRLKDSNVERFEGFN